MNKHYQKRVEQVKDSVTTELKKIREVKSIDLVVTGYDSTEQYTGKFNFDNGQYIEFGTFTTQVTKLPLIRTDAKNDTFIYFENIFKRYKYDTHIQLKNLRQSYGGKITQTGD
jgi:hypothetical protein